MAHIERLGYPTQKPFALLERILNASSNPGDVVLDPFCGCGTTIHAAQKLGRAWIGIDITHLAITVIRKRLYDAFGQIEYSVQGVPNDLESARQFFEANDPAKKEFEKWAVGLVAFMPQDKKGADGGFDGAEWFGPSKEFKALVSVKGGKNIRVKDVRELDSVVSARGAKAGIFLTLERPTRDMVQWAKQAGTCEVPGFASVNRIQIVSIEDAMRLGPRAVNLPARHSDTYRRARPEPNGRQGAFEI